MPRPPDNLKDFKSLVQIVEILRGPEGCPWDKEQTHSSLTRHAIEEAHELAEAIDSGNKTAIVEELGDLLLQVLLHAEIAKQGEQFTFTDIVEALGAKLVRRHTHVFGDVKVTDGKGALENWAKMKDKEKTKEKNPFASIPKTIPALIRAQKIGDRTVRFNFDWDNNQQVIEKIEEELAELKEAIDSKPLSEQQNELGDLLFSVTQLARHLNFDAEQALRLTNTKFETRFIKMRELVDEDKKNFKALSTAELEKYWQKAKIDLQSVKKS